MGLVNFWAVAVAVLVFVVVPFIFFVPKPKIRGVRMSLLSHMKSSSAKPSTKDQPYATGSAKVVKLMPEEHLTPGQSRVVRVLLHKGEVVAVTFGGSDRGIPFIPEVVQDKERAAFWRLFYRNGRQGSIRRIELVTTED